MAVEEPSEYDQWIESVRKNLTTGRRKIDGKTVTSLMLLAGIVFVIFAPYGRGTVRPETMTPIRPYVAADEQPGRTDADDEVSELAEQAYEFVVSIHADSGMFAASGTGVIVSQDGYIVTNKHVVADSDAVYVRINGEIDSEPATLIGVSRDTDLAVLKVERTNLVSGVFAKKDTVKVGDPVIAVGYSAALVGLPSISKGIVSGLGRTLDAGDGTMLKDMVQTDAALSSGNSGGPLLNEKGNIIGINTLVLESRPTEFVSNIGFAINSDKVVDTLTAITTGNTPKTSKPGMLGISVKTRGQGSLGVEVESIRPRSGALAAGMQVGDVVVSVNDEPVNDTSEIKGALQDRQEGERVKVGIQREGLGMILEVVLGPKTEN